MMISRTLPQLDLLCDRIAQQTRPTETYTHRDRFQGVRTCIRPARKAEPFEASAGALSFYDEVLKLAPCNEAQRSLQVRAIDASNDVAKTPLLLFAEAGGI